MKRYVLGFCFVPGGGCVLIQKTKPDWQNGLVNGLGGSIEPGETIYRAMVREFREECGVPTHEKQWHHAVTFGTQEWELNVLRCILPYTPTVISCDEGEVSIFDSPPQNVETTAVWLYWMCRDNSTFGLLSKEQPHDLQIEV